MIVVSDTSAITSLLQIGRIDLLTRLYGEVVIPTAVERELRHDHPVLPDCLRVERVADRAQVERLVRAVDLGEAEAIALMIEGRGDLLLMDERRGRLIAQNEGVPVIGLLGALTEAKQRGVIASLAEIVERLQRVAGFRVSPELKRRLLAEAGE
jgi:hypothetical protein